MESFVRRAISSVEEFHRVFGHPINVGFPEGVVDRKLLTQRVALINEESRELSDALESRPMEIGLSTMDIQTPFDSQNPVTQAADGLGDLMYVIGGTFVAFGLTPPTTYSFPNTLTAGFPSINIDLATPKDVESYANDCLLTVLKLARVLFTRSGSSMENFYRIFDYIHSNNMSKLCSSVERAEVTIKNYCDQGISAGYRESLIPGKYTVYNLNTGKILKSIDWVEPDFSKILEASFNEI